MMMKMHEAERRVREKWRSERDDGARKQTLSEPSPKTRSL
jgi:hypothetical protein